MLPSVKLSEEDKIELEYVYERTKTGVADSVATTARMIALYNKLYKTGYKENTSCRKCLATVHKKIKLLYELSI
tara:strand:- start:30 stop:251 length:222 start_codon:yes stop_codon:yes gene_type:complete